ncbi:MAG TPA: GNAT family N-acetyltransferase [Candidatus Eisenbacteria bacterium]
MSDPNSIEPGPSETTPVTVVIGPAPFNAHEGIAELLRSAALPVPDPEDSPVQMMAAFAGPHLIGCIGWEQYGASALVRSLAVLEDVRGEGVGTALVGALVAVLKGIGVDEAWLLTTDAAGWFERHDFERTDREAIPEAVRVAREIRLPCCATAQVMRRRLDS